MVEEELDRWNECLRADDPKQEYEPLVTLITGLRSHHLVKHLSKALPLSLRLLDHHHVQHKLLGIRAVSHLMLQLPTETLRDTGSDLLLLHSLKGCIAHQELMTTVIPVLVQAMRRASIGPTSDMADDIILTLVRGLDLSTSLDSKLIHWQSLRVMIQFAGLAIVRVGKRIVKRMSDHLSYPLTPESSEMFHQLFLTVESFITAVTCERCHRFSPQILFSVSCFCYSNYKVLTEEIRSDVKSLMRLLEQMDPSSVQHAVQVIRSNDPEDRMSLIVRGLAHQIENENKRNNDDENNCDESHGDGYHMQSSGNEDIASGGPHPSPA